MDLPAEWDRVLILCHGRAQMPNLYFERHGGETQFTFAALIGGVWGSHFLPLVYLLSVDEG